MRPASVPALLLLGLSGCTAHENFAEEYSLATCDLFADCEVLEIMGDFETIDQCNDTLNLAMGPEGTDCPDFDRSNQNDCLEGILLMTCDDLYAENWPEACDAACP